MDTEEAEGVPTPVVFEEVHGNQDQGRKSDHVNIAFRHAEDDDGSNGVVFALRDGEDVNVVVEEGGSSDGSDGDESGQRRSGYTMIRHEEVKMMREELEQAKKTVERQVIEMEKAKEMIMEQRNRIVELEEDKKKHKHGIGGGEGGGKEERGGSSLKGGIEDLEKTIEGLKKVVREKDEQLHQKELLILQKDAEYDIVKTMNISVVVTLKKLLSDEREKRVIAEMQVKMLLSSVEPVEYLGRRETGNDLTSASTSQRTPDPPVHVSTFSQTENLDSVDDIEDEDEDVLFIEEVEKETGGGGNGEVVDADSGYPRCDSEDESEKVDDLMNQRFVCKACGLVCTTNLNLMKHIRATHGLTVSQLQGKIEVNSEQTGTVTPISGPGPTTSTSVSPHNLRKRNPSNTVLINDIRRSSSSSSTSSASGNWSSDKNINFKGNGKFICTVCGDRYPIVSKLKVHMKQAHGIQDDRFSIGCKDCGIIFYDRKEHVFHRKVTHGTQYNGRGRGSNTLTRPSSSAAILPDRNDQEARAPVLLPEAPGSSTQPLVEHAVDIKRLREGCFCTCGLEFRTTSHIKIHIKLCNKTDRMSPQIPTKNSVNLDLDKAESFETKMIIDENGMRILTIQPPSSRSPPIPQIHRLVGKDPKVHRAKYHCACGKIYFNRASFQIHAKSKNMGRIFKCGWCTMSFDLHGNLKSHVRAYHKAIYGNGKFACGNCAQTFATSRQLSRHRTQDCMSK